MEKQQIEALQNAIHENQKAVNESQKAIHYLQSILSQMTGEHNIIRLTNDRQSEEAEKRA